MDSLNAVRTSNNVVTDIARNDYVVAIVAILAIAYAGTFAPKLPNNVASFLDNIIVKFVIFYVIAFVVSRKVDVALISSLAVLALVLGVQVYLADTPAKVAASKMEKMVGGFQPILGQRQAEVTINKGNFMENEPLNEDWVKKSGEVQGYSLDWPGYENIQSDQVSVDTGSVISSASSGSSGSSSVVAVNDKHNEPADGEIVGVSKVDMSGLAKV
jgi:hypothetical protein